MTECLHAAGFLDVELTPDGEGYTTSAANAAEAKALAVAQYACWVQYPIDPKYTKPLTDDQVKALFAYFAGPLSDCLREQGYVPSTPPSEASFVEAYSSGNAWNPLNEVLASLSQQGEILALSQACPSVPEGLYG